MNTVTERDGLGQRLAALRELIDGHADVQQMLDLAADEADRRAAAQESSRRLAWRVAGAFGGLALVAFMVAGGAVATAMRPAPPPDVLVVDKRDGVVQPLISLATYQMDPDEVTIRRMITTLVTACEGYSYEQADTHYYDCAAFLSSDQRAEWAKLWDQNNPESPPNKYKQTKRIRSTVGAITMLRNGLGKIIGARASFKKTLLVNNVEEGKPTSWIATFSFRWVNRPTSERERRVNDLGMEVTDRVVDRDLGQGESAPVQVAPIQQASSQSGAGTMALVVPAQTQGGRP